jgi:hypothetical protein
MKIIELVISGNPLFSGKTTDYASYYRRERGFSRQARLILDRHIE